MKVTVRRPQSRVSIVVPEGRIDAVSGPKLRVLLRNQAKQGTPFPTPSHVYGLLGAERPGIRVESGTSPQGCSVPGRPDPSGTHGPADDHDGPNLPHLRDGGRRAGRALHPPDLHDHRGGRTGHVVIKTHEQPASRPGQAGFTPWPVTSSGLRPSGVRPGVNCHPTGKGGETLGVLGTRAGGRNAIRMRQSGLGHLIPAFPPSSAAGGRPQAGPWNRFALP